MNLSFRMNRTIDEEDASIEQMNEWSRQYEAFVASHRTGMPRDLWRYFGIDAFHDGLINSIKFDSTCRNVAVHITCPNVKYLGSSGQADFEFVNVDFGARFEGVYKFVLERQQEELSRNVPFPAFLYAEVETAQEEIKDAVERTGEAHHSLIIKADVLRAGIIFHYLNVTAIEPVATELMMRDSRFRLPFLD